MNEKQKRYDSARQSEQTGREPTAEPGLFQSVTRSSLLTLGALVAMALVLVTVFPERREPVAERSLEYLLEMAGILPAVVVLLGLFSVFVPKQLIASYLGAASGVKGFFLSLGLGALPTGPLYVAFPIAAAMIRKGASVRNMVAFLTAWASVKLPQEMVELRFMGLEFAALRLALTIMAALIIGWITERVVHGGSHERSD
ncbi:MAG: permease [Spirochaetaceae bacterium]